MALGCCSAGNDDGLRDAAPRDCRNREKIQLYPARPRQRYFGGQICEATIGSQSSQSFSLP
jgi:hypothetical protein